MRKEKRSHVKKRKINWSITEVITQSPIQANSFQMLQRKLVMMKGMNWDDCPRWLRMEGHGKELANECVNEECQKWLVVKRESDLTENGEVKGAGDGDCWENQKITAVVSHLSASRGVHSQPRYYPLTPWSRVLRIFTEADQQGPSSRWHTVASSLVPPACHKASTH